MIQRNTAVTLSSMQIHLSPYRVANPYHPFLSPPLTL